MVVSQLSARASARELLLRLPVAPLARSLWMRRHRRHGATNLPGRPLRFPARKIGLTSEPSDWSRTGERNSTLTGPPENAVGATVTHLARSRPVASRAGLPSPSCASSRTRAAAPFRSQLPPLPRRPEPVALEASKLGTSTFSDEIGSLLAGLGHFPFIRPGFRACKRGSSGYRTRMWLQPGQQSRLAIPLELRAAGFEPFAHFFDFVFDAS